MNIYSTFKTVVAQAGAILFLGLLGFWMILGIGTGQHMPDYAVVYIDDDTKTYIALPCVKNWLDKHSAPEISYDLRRSKAMEARQLKYKLDDDCRDT